jgi:hypothetical protein
MIEVGKLPGEGMGLKSPWNYSSPGSLLVQHHVGYKRFYCTSRTM